MKLFTVLSTLLAPSAVFCLNVQQPLIQHGSSIHREENMANLLQAMETMQTEFFEIWMGTWPDAIDWTRAVMGTHIAAGAYTFAKAGFAEDLSLKQENIVSTYFSQLVAYYFGQDAFEIRLQAYDDMLWVVLGWLDAVQLSTQHSRAHFENQQENLTWYGTSFSPAFAHRARIFWETAVNGWDETLCGGGMIWSPWLTPYKNAITNELFISASINMYLYFPGDDNEIPFSTSRDKQWKKHDKKYLDAAVKAYDWLIDSNMMDEQGLFFDGFHIEGWSKHDNGTGKCDVPDKKVYTYNQGVILSSHRGLWSATGDLKYLLAGHTLIRNVIAATGWSIKEDKAIATTWSGLGRNGVLEEACDSEGYCSQDGQTFKGIFFHHLTVFCQRLPTLRQPPPFHWVDRFTANLHRQSCLEYAPWVERNAKAAMGTRNDKGVIGMWWTIGLGEDDVAGEPPQDSAAAVDYRNQGIPDDKVWRLHDSKVDDNRFQSGRHTTEEDPNNRGRGRTVETHSGGVAVLRAHYELSALQRVVT